MRCNLRVYSYAKSMYHNMDELIFSFCFRLFVNAKTFRKNTHLYKNINVQKHYYSIYIVTLKISKFGMLVIPFVT
jgi:hypothetical protein